MRAALLLVVLLLAPAAFAGSQGSAGHLLVILDEPIVQGEWAFMVGFVRAYAAMPEFSAQMYVDGALVETQRWHFDQDMGGRFHIGVIQPIQERTYHLRLVLDPHGEAWPQPLVVERNSTFGPRPDLVVTFATQREESILAPWPLGATIAHFSVCNLGTRAMVGQGEALITRTDASGAWLMSQQEARAIPRLSVGGCADVPVRFDEFARDGEREVMVQAYGLSPQDESDLDASDNAAWTRVQLGPPFLR
ncbi:MAG TPA: hypothetical protein VM582_08975 [Candidatus Thermoplasmatota archaeon]|nr:hypothetical protein [Candidatus Thermoplasmatota archaeon]